MDNPTPEQHRELAVQANNASWELLGPTGDSDQPTLSPDDAFDLLGRAYAAAYHWRRATGAGSIDAARAAWLCSRAHAVTGDGNASLRMAEHCDHLASECGDDAKDFDHFYTTESIARALACLGTHDEAIEAYHQAKAKLSDVADPEDHKIAASDLDAGPWFGLRRDR